MADFVSVFLDGLKEKRDRQERQARLAEQTRQFERQMAARNFEFNAERALQMQQQKLNEQREQRLEERQKFQDTLSLADLQARGVADEAIEGIDEFTSNNVVESPSGQRIRLLSPEERSERETQFAIGNFKSRVEAGAAEIEKLEGPEAAQRFRQQMYTPANIAQFAGIKSPQREPQVSSLNQLQAILEAKVAAGEELTPQEEQVRKRIAEQSKATSALRVQGPGGLVTSPPTYKQQVDTIVENQAAALRPVVSRVTGLTPEQIVADPEQAIVTIGDAFSKMDIEPSVRPFISVIVQKIVEDIVRANKKPAGGSTGLGIPGLGGPLTAEEQADISR